MEVCLHKLLWDNFTKVQRPSTLFLNGLNIVKVSIMRYVLGIYDILSRFIPDIYDILWDFFDHILYLI
jgi:hypothetical protein